MQIKLLFEEVWLPVIGYETEYLVSNYSRVLSIKYAKHVLLSPSKIGKNDRYKKVGLFNTNGKRTKYGIHKISATAFIPNPGNLPEVNHMDDDRENNHISNFEWTTHRENVNHGKITRGKNSKFVGVTKNCNGKRWRARIYLNKKHIFIGVYDTEHEASEAYQKYCVDHGISLKYVA